MDNQCSDAAICYGLWVQEDAGWQRQNLSLLRRLQLSLCRQVVMQFALQVACDAHRRDVIDRDQVNELIRMVNRRGEQQEDILIAPYSE